ncbi:hypothetical protein BJ546DRAFT_292062 [Cryomyces antarcticus]
MTEFGIEVKLEPCRRTYHVKEQGEFCDFRVPRQAVHLTMESVRRRIRFYCFQGSSKKRSVFESALRPNLWKIDLSLITSEADSGPQKDAVTTTLKQKTLAARRNPPEAAHAAAKKARQKNPEEMDKAIMAQKGKIRHQMRMKKLLAAGLWTQKDLS